MLLFVDLECDGESVKDLGDAAKVLANVVEQAKNLARNGMDRENIVQPILNGNGDKVGEWEWVVDKKRRANNVNGDTNMLDLLDLDRRTAKALA